MGLIDKLKEKAKGLAARRGRKAGAGTQPIADAAEPKAGDQQA